MKNESHKIILWGNSWRPKVPNEIQIQIKSGGEIKGKHWIIQDKSGYVEEENIK